MKKGEKTDEFNLTLEKFRDVAQYNHQCGKRRQHRWMQHLKHRNYEDILLINTKKITSLQNGDQTLNATPTSMKFWGCAPYSYHKNQPLGNQGTHRWMQTLH